MLYMLHICVVCTSYIFVVYVVYTCCIYVIYIESVLARDQVHNTDAKITMIFDAWLLQWYASHLEPLIIYNISLWKFTTHNDIY